MELMIEIGLHESVLVTHALQRALVEAGDNVRFFRERRNAEQFARWERREEAFRRLAAVWLERSQKIRSTTEAYSEVEL